MNAYIYTYLCRYLYLGRVRYVCMYVDMHKSVCMYPNVYVFMHSCMYVCM